MAFTLAVAIVQGHSADVDVVRRALWLPRKPDTRMSVEDLSADENRSEHVGILRRRALVFVFGMPAVLQTKAWEELSKEGGRVFTFVHCEDGDPGAWAIYDDGRRVRWFDPADAAAPSGGAPHSLEPPADPEEIPVERIEAIYEAMVAEDLTQDLDLDAEVPVWKVK